MAVTAERVTVGGTAVALNTENTFGMTLAIANVGSEVADLGPSGVGAGAGYELGSGATATVELDAGDVLFAISGTGTDLAVLRT